MTKTQRDLRQYLTLLHDVATHNQEMPKRWVYQGPADLLLREAKFYKPSKVVHWDQSLKQACFRNAAMYAVLNGLRYVEGYASSIIPVHHGWCADDAGNVIEVTWDTVGSLYFGVEFPPLKVARGSVLWNERNLSVYRRLIKKGAR